MRAVCPECGTPVAGTLLAVLDPQAAELQPIRRPFLTAAGLSLWALGALGTALVDWLLRVCEAFQSVSPPAWAPTLAAALLVMSGFAGMVMFRPHAGIPRIHRVMVLGASACCFMLAWVGVRIVELDGLSGRPYLGGGEWSPRWGWKIIETILIGLMVLGYQPMFRTLQARSFLLRIGQVERQTLRALAASVGVILAGDLIQASVRKLQFSVDIGAVLGMCVTGVGTLLLTAGLLGVVMDVRRLLPVIITPPLGLKDVLGSASGVEAHTGVAHAASTGHGTEARP